MEFTDTEVIQVQETIFEATQAQLGHLSELHLTFAGGGMADVVL